jgi:hypothetical protein
MNDTCWAYFESFSVFREYCNTESNIGRGYEYWGVQAPAWTDIRHNSMDNNLKGFVLTNTILGQQGDATHPVGEKWLGSWSSNLQTWVNSNSSTYSSIYSPLYVSSIDSPIYNNGLPVIRSYGSSGLFHASGAILNCDSIHPVYAPHVSNPYSTLEKVAQNSLGFTDEDKPAQWMTQFAMWRTLITDSIFADSVLVDSSHVLLAFKDSAALSRFKYLTDIEGQIALGNFDSARSLISEEVSAHPSTNTDSSVGTVVADYSDADGIVSDYKQYYTLLLNYFDTTLSSSDSTAIITMAHLCPNTNGAVVYYARALYTEVFNDVNMWNEDALCGYTEGKNAIRNINSTNPGISHLTKEGVQHYRVFPNPASGSINIQQSIFDAEPVQAEIWNVEGIRVYKKQLSFDGKAKNIPVNSLSPGLYLLQLRDSKGSNYTLKFIVN